MSTGCWRRLSNSRLRNQTTGRVIAGGEGGLGIPPVRSATTGFVVARGSRPVESFRGCLEARFESSP